MWAKKHWLISALALLVGSCAFSIRDRTVSWEEEVPLNTGETIWVKRSMPWVYKGGFGNPFDMDMRPTGEHTFQFTYGGVQYSFTGRVAVEWIAISPTRHPVLVGIPGSYGWNYQYGSVYYCVVPYYVQFNPDASGTKWTWPEKIDPWLFNLPPNLMANIPRLKETRSAKYTNGERNIRDKTHRTQLNYARQIDPVYDASGDCPKKSDQNPIPKKSTK